MDDFDQLTLFGRRELVALGAYCGCGERLTTCPKCRRQIHASERTLTGCVLCNWFDDGTARKRSEIGDDRPSRSHGRGAY